MRHILTMVGLLILSASAGAFEISTENGAEAELEAVAILEALRIANDLSPWEFTDNVHVQAGVIPHSHPVLTINTRHNAPEERDVFLSTYLHEQIHWHADAHETAVNAAVEELRALYPEVPAGNEEGARDEYSTYLHLIVCWLELDAVARLLSPERREAVIGFWQNDHYKWIYRTVPADWEQIGDIIRRYGLEIPAD